MNNFIKCINNKFFYLLKSNENIKKEIPHINANGTLLKFSSLITTYINTNFLLVIEFKQVSQFSGCRFLYENTNAGATEDLKVIKCVISFIIRQ